METTQQVKQFEALQADKNYIIPYDRNIAIDYDQKTPFTRWLKAIDDKIWKLDRWRFCTMIGESWSGKTTFLFFSMLQLTKQYKVLFLSLEMPPSEVIKLRAIKMAWVSISERDNKTMNNIQKDMIDMEIKNITRNTNLQLWYIKPDLDKEVDINRILNCIQASYSDCDYIVIDNLWFIKSPSDKARSITEETNDIIRKCKWFCDEKKKTIMMIHHFNKWSSISRKNRSPADIRDSWKLENDVDYMVFISRSVMTAEEWEEASEEDRALVYFDLVKNRIWGDKKRVFMYFYYGQYYAEYPWKSVKGIQNATKEDDYDDSFKG